MKNKLEIYHNTMSDAITAAYNYAREKGYEVVENMFIWESITYGQSRDYHIDLIKDGKEQKKCLQLQLYRMESGKYELNCYIN